MDLEWAKLIPWIAALGAVLCGICCMNRRLRKLAAPICIGSLGLSFLLSVLVAPGVHRFDPQMPADESAKAHVVKAFEWIHVGGLKADFAYFLDPLTVLMLFVVTGVGTLVAIYAAGYMKGDRGYARFFAGICLFIFTMTTLVMADNLLLLYLGWEGVGLCSYLLIGYYYDKPSAVAAAKKAFIVNRVGDLGFAIGIFWIYFSYNTVSISEVVRIAAAGDVPGTDSAKTWIPFLLMLGAFGKSAQLPLYVWLPDAMEGPTPVSALIHAATMVTAGVYMIARLLPVFVLSPYALPTVAAIGGVTALFAATIALCQYDIKRIYAYSTISQLGYMFLGVGALSAVGGVFHLFTHAFFKALLFLTAGSVMHALAGQVDLRKMSGLRHKMPITAILMLIGCLALSGFPFITAGFYSKDLILASALEKGLSEHNPLYTVLAVVGLLTALLTAFYTFRLWFRVFTGPVEYEMGDQHHGNEHGHGHTETGKIRVVHHHEPHEMPWLMNAPLVVLALGAIFAGFFGVGEYHGWVGGSLDGSTAHIAAPGHGDTAPLTLLGMNLHTAMMVISSVIAIVGITAAAYYHWLNRAAAEQFAERFPRLVRLLADKYYVDELYHAVIVKPLRVIGELCYVFDRLVIDGLVSAVTLVPKGLGWAAKCAQTGALQGYGLGMAIGATVVVLLVIIKVL